MQDITLQIRKVIFQKYNDPNLRFTNDEILAVLQKEGVLDKSITIDDIGQHFTALCKSGLMRNIAQNFTTQWFKLFEPLEELNCPSCGKNVYLGKSEDRVCPNPECKATI